jgi:hypothetical protein
VGPPSSHGTPRRPCYLIDIHHSLITGLSPSLAGLKTRSSGCPQPLCYPVSETSSEVLVFQFRVAPPSYATPPDTVCIRTGNQNQGSFYPYVLHEISVLMELPFGRFRYLLRIVPPQPNSPTDYVFNLDLRDRGQDALLNPSLSSRLTLEEGAFGAAST